jgi:hypothetical protein
VGSKRNEQTDLASHVHRKVSIATGVCYGSGNKDIRGLLLLLEVAGDGVRIEEDIKDERLWLCHPSVVMILSASSNTQ